MAQAKQGFDGIDPKLIEMAKAYGREKGWSHVPVQFFPNGARRSGEAAVTKMVPVNIPV